MTDMEVVYQMAEEIKDLTAQNVDMETRLITLRKLLYEEQIKHATYARPETLRGATVYIQDVLMVLGYEDSDRALEIIKEQEAEYAGDR